MKNELLEAALRYAEMELSVIPVVPGKKIPLIKWEEFQERRAAREEIVSWWEKTPNANVGIVTGPISNIAVVDIDTDEGKEAILEYIPDSVEVPTTKTPRGGNHLVFLYPENFDVGNNAKVIPGCDFRGKGGFVVAPPSVNGNGNGYEWLIEFSRQTLLPLPAAYIKKVQNNSFYIRGSSKSEVNVTTEHYKRYEILQEGRRDNDLFHIANCMVKGGSERFVIEQVLERLIISFGENPDQKWIKDKIESALKRAVRRERSLADEVREWILLQEGYFFTTDVQQTLQITTKEDKKNLTVILVRLQQEGMIEKYGDKRGCYRPVAKQVEENQFIETPFSEFPIRLPLQLNDLCRLYAKNIVVIAGTKSSGKTAMMLKIALDNQARMPVVYLNSEMGDEEYTERLKNFGVTSSGEVQFKTFPVHNNFHDRITGERKIFIVDYLEVHDNFYEVAKPIRAIHEKLKDGICIIGIQKKSGGKDPCLLGRGGDFSMEKSRLYLSMDYVDALRATKVTIADAKSPKIPGGVRGMFRHVKIVGGSKFTPLDDSWRS